MKNTILFSIVMLLLFVSVSEIACAQVNDGRIKKAQIYLQSEEFEKAKEILSGMVKGGDGNMDVHFMLGLAHLGLKEYDDAEASFVRVLQMDNTCEPAYLQLAATQMERKKYEEAERSLNNLLRVNAKSAVGHYAMGVVQFNKNEIIKATKEFNDAILCDKEFAPAYENLGVIFYNKDQFKEAMENFQKAADYDKLEPRHLFNAGWTLRTMGEQEKSYSYFSRSSNLKAPSAYSITWKIIQAYDKKDFKKAEEHVAELFLVDKTFDKGFYFKALLLMNDKKYKEANDIVAEMLKENPHDRDARDLDKKLKPLLEQAGTEDKTVKEEPQKEEVKKEEPKKEEVKPEEVKKEDNDKEKNDKDKNDKEESLSEELLKQKEEINKDEK